MMKRKRECKDIKATCNNIKVVVERMSKRNDEGDPFTKDSERPIPERAANKPTKDDDDDEEEEDFSHS